MTRSTRLSSKRVGGGHKSDTHAVHKKASFADLNQSFQGSEDGHTASPQASDALISTHAQSSKAYTKSDQTHSQPATSNVKDTASPTGVDGVNDSPIPSAQIDIALLHPKHRLLVVDDSAMNRKMLCKALKLHGYLYTEATDGVKAVEIVKEALINKTVTFDGILMDYIMPNMDGPTATEEIRKLGYIQPIIGVYYTAFSMPAIILCLFNVYSSTTLGVTGNALQSDIDHFTSHGASRVLIKPVQTNELRAVLEGMLLCCIMRYSMLIYN